MPRLGYWERWHWFDWPLFSRRDGARAILDRVPRRCRTWPGLRRYYWQAGELEIDNDRFDAWRDGGPTPPPGWEE